MALSNEIHWEVRNTGSDSNGGGFDQAIGATHTDYSQQNAAQLNLNDIVCLPLSNEITSVTGGFTAAMIGNVIQILSGLRFIPGYYMMVGTADASRAMLDRTPNSSVVLSATGGLMNLGGGFATMQNLGLQGRFYVKKHTVGSYVFGGGGAASEVRWLGYDGSHAVEPTGANRPTVVLSSNNWRTGYSSIIANFNIENTTSYYLYMGPRGLMANCRVTVKSAYTAQYILRADEYTCIFDTELTQESSNEPARFINIVLHSRHFMNFWNNPNFSVGSGGIIVGTGAILGYNVMARSNDDMWDLNRDDNTYFNNTAYDAPLIMGRTPDPDISDIAALEMNLYSGIHQRHMGRWLGRTHKENIYGTPPALTQNEQLRPQPTSFYFRFPEFADEDNDDFSLQVPNYFDVGEVQILGV